MIKNHPKKCINPERVTRVTPVEVPNGDDDDVYLRKITTRMSQNWISTQLMQTSQYGISKKSQHTNDTR
jgi:hypothetical protein